MKNKILHIMHNDKFNGDYINFINQNFDPQNHLFIFIADAVGELFPIPQQPNVIKLFFSKKRFYRYLLLIYYCIKADKIILHGLFINSLINFLAINCYLLKKCYWVIWGGDLYDDVFALELGSSQRKKIHFRLKNFICSRFKGYITYINGDYKLAKQTYGGNATFAECIMYPSNVSYNQASEIKIPNTLPNSINILVGNSATQTNNHFEIFQKIKQENLLNVFIWCPLNYGDQEYANEVIKQGYQIFGDKFKPITKMMTLTDYQKFLLTIDVAIFNHNRQQGMGNIINILGMGKTVYVRDDLTTWSLFEKLSVTAFNTKSDKLNINYALSQNISKNIVIIKHYFSIDNLVKQSSLIFNGEI